LTLLSIVTPPANVPGAILIVSPSLAASSAAWSVAKQPGPLPTQTFPAADAEVAAATPTTIAARTSA
jgi:hypothetical protein